MTEIKLKPIQDQVVAVVGASSGIGRATALQFAQKGAKVAVVSRSEPGLVSLVQEITQMGGEAIAIMADVANFEQVQAIGDKTVQHFGRLDTWVHNAATSIFAPFEQITPEEFKRVIDVNLMGQVYGAMVALPLLKREGRGALIHVTSVEARRSLPLQSPYSASKHGAEGFLDSLRVELMHEKAPISLTNILPSTINTPFYNKGMTKLGVKPMSLPPYYHPSLVADAIVYASEHPVRDMIVGDSGRVLDLAQKVAPGLLDSILSLIAIQGQKTNEIKLPDDPNNLYSAASTGEYDRVEGDYNALTTPSFLDSLDKHPLFKWGAFAGLGLLAMMTGMGGAMGVKDAAESHSESL
ncbi:MAG: SDR family oxidoreductase [Oculatellaceae cyanobacterium Prado106]|jgi:NAD(P)-dependent dehydrogenase (short-subunit alcohol dehydrogenase family)|nr:SDR family oxidoreductase [Oculatellaceae cyanobacterium Prado106]